MKTSSQNISITLLQISLKLDKHRGRYWRKKLPWTILEEQFPVLRYTAASKIGNSVISLLWQLRCRCNPDHNKFSSLSNTTVVSIFPNLCLWRRSLRSNLGGIDPEKLYRATLNVTSQSRGALSQDHWMVTKRVNDKTDNATSLLVDLKYEHSFNRDDRHYELAEVVILRQIGWWNAVYCLLIFLPQTRNERLSNWSHYIKSY